MATDSWKEITDATINRKRRAMHWDRDPRTSHGSRKLQKKEWWLSSVVVEGPVCKNSKSVVPSLNPSQTWNSCLFYATLYPGARWDEVYPYLGAWKGVRDNTEEKVCVKYRRAPHEKSLSNFNPIQTCCKKTASAPLIASMSGCRIAVFFHIFWLG